MYIYIYHIIEWNANIRSPLEAFTEQYADTSKKLTHNRESCIPDQRVDANELQHLEKLVGLKQKVCVRNVDGAPFIALWSFGHANTGFEIRLSCLYSNGKKIVSIH